MGETEGEIAPRDSEEPEAAPAQESLQVPAQKKRKLKSPTPGSLRGRSATPIRGRSQTPFNLYMTRRSATPSTWRSITPFLKREEKEKTPFELGREIKVQTICNKAVFDRALVMDISEPEEIQKPVRYITSDFSVIDRAAVMDVSNVEVIYVVEEYEEVEEEEIIEEVKPKKKEKKPRKPRVQRKSVDKEASPSAGGEGEADDVVESLDEREDSVDFDEDEPVKKGKKKAAPKKKEKKEKSPSPKLSLKLEIGGGQKASKKMFEQQPPPAAGPKPPPKKSKMVLQMEEQARAAAKAAEEEANRAKPKGETYEERQKRLQAEKEEEERIAAELRAQEEAEAEEEPEEVDEEGDEGEDGEREEGGEEGDDYHDDEGNEDDEGRDKDEGGEEDEEQDEVGELPDEKRRGSDSSEDFVRPDPMDDEKWQRIAAIEGEEFMQQMRKYSIAKRRSEKERDEEWQKRREQARLPHFAVFLSDRTVEAGQSVRLACAADGPELSVKWFKDGKQLQRDGTHRIINNNNILILEVVNTTILDSGEYKCIIANSNDEVTSSCIVTIYEVFKDEPKPPSIQFMREYYHLRDDELAIECHVHGVPRPVVTWWRGVFQVKASYKFTIIEEAHGVCKLLIYKPGNKDGGIYTCRAFNSSGEAQINHTVEVAKNLHYHVPGIFHARDRIQQDKEKQAKRAMEAALKSKAQSDEKRAEIEAEQQRVRAARPSPEPLVPSKQKLQFATQLRDRMALEGTTVKFAVTVIGPQPNTRWMKDDKWLQVGGNIRNLSEEGKAIIEIGNVSPDASGVYKCVAKNDHSEIETSCYFKVYSAQADGDEQEPMFALPLRDVYHSSQNDLILDTKVRGNPRPVISWTKDKIPVVLDDRVVQIEHLDGVCELIINKPTANDNGVYVCEAKNKLGSQTATHTVVVDTTHSRRSSVLLMSDTEGSESGKKASKAARKKKEKEEEAADGGYERRSRMPDPSPKQTLYFTVNLSNRYVAEGSKVKLQAIIGGPEPTIKWQKDDQNVQFGPRIRNMNRDSLAVLEFLNAQAEDSGTYSIIAQNEFCKITTSAMLHVYQPKVNTDVQPVFIRPLKETFHLNSNELILETAIRGQPSPQVQWFKDSVEVENGGRFQILEHQDGTCELIIDNPDKRDSGRYVVKAENRAGKVEVSHLVQFRGIESHIADNIHGVFHADKSLMRPKEVEKPKEKPKPAAADSDAEGDDKGKRRGKKPEEDEYASATDYASDSASLSSKRREKHIGIHFSTSMRDRVVAEGSKVKISCFLEAKEPQVKWFKNEEQIQNSPKMRGRYSEGLCLFEIMSATLEDSGEYKCWGRDETGEVSTSCKLEVYENPGTGDVPPTFTRNIKDTLHGKINELQLDVHVRGLPTPTITWVKDGVKIENSEKYQQVDHEDGTSELFVSKPDAADSGKYVCQAENREGTTEIVHMVTVEPRRRRPISPLREARPPVPPGEGEVEGEEKERKRKPKEEEEEQSSRREVPPPPDMKKRLYFRNFLSNRTVKSGSNVKWMVNIDGPEPVARWFHGDQAIAFGPKSKMSMQDGIAWLNLVGVTEEDAGEYTLKIRGSENEIVSTCNLFVYSTGKEEVITPTFTVGIKDAYQTQNNQLTLECKVSGNPKPQIYWQKDNTLLPLESAKYQCVENEDGLKQLVITDFNDADSGLYTCYAESENGQMKISKFVQSTDYIRARTTTEKKSIEKLLQDIKQEDRNVKTEDITNAKIKSRDAQLKLNLETNLKSMTISSGNKAQLICYVSGFIEDVYWLKGNERVTKDTRHKIYNINGAISLEIYDAKPEDSDEYKCVVRNNRQSVESICQLNILDASKDELPESFSNAITASYDAQRNEIELSCQVHGRPTVTWMRDDHTIFNNRYKSVEDIGGVRKLIIRNPISSDCGVFSCYAEHENRIDSISKSIKIADLKRLMAADAQVRQPEFDYANSLRGDVNANQLTTNKHENEDFQLAGNRLMRSVEQTKPRFNTFLHDRTVSAGTNVRLVCNVVGSPDKVEWLKNHNPLPKDTRYQTVYQNGEASLEIFAADANDSGNYTCSASNAFGETLTHAQLRIYKHFEDASMPSTFTQPIRDTYSLNENELVLDCRVRGKPQPVVQWMKGNDLIVEDAKFKQTTQPDGYSKLVITNPTEKDSGLYSCVARNEGAENKISHHVEFVGREQFTLQKTRGFYHRDPNKPHFIAPLGNQTVCHGGTIAITAEFTQTNTPIEVLWFLNRQPLAGVPKVKAIADRSVYTLTVTDAGPEVEGTYTCRAINAFGRIESHANVDVSIGAERDERPPLFLSRPDNEMKIALGDPFSLSFRIAGDPKPKLTFMKGTKDITLSDRVSKEVSDDYTRFTVQNSQIADNGTYFVVARNNFGTDRIFVTVNVTPRARSETPTLPRWGQSLDSYSDTSYFRDPPGPISTEPLVVDAGPTHISLSWGKPIVNNSAPVIAYKVEAWIVGHEGGAIWREIGLTPINSFDAFNLKSNVEYHFRVTPKNRYGWGPAIQTSSALQVGGVECLPEFVNILPGQVKALLGANYTLQCTIRGAPRPKVTWYKDGIQLNTLSERVKIRQLGSACALTISHVGESDAGRYTCEATNSKGRVSTFARLQVVADPRLYEADSRLKDIVHGKNLVGESLPIFTMRLRDRRVQVTYPVRLTCQIVGYPTPEIFWYKDDNLITIDKRHHISIDGQFYTLEITTTTLDDSGNYTCTAKNELGSVSCHCSLIVDKGIRAYISPEFYVPLDPFYIFCEGDEIRISAKVEAYPAVGVTWHRNGVRLRPSRRIQATLDANGYVELIISEANARDAGIYMCVASNVVGKVETSCRVAIEEAERDTNHQLDIPSIRTNDMPYSKEPLFVVKPRSSEAYEGDTVIIFCEVVGDPKPEVVWLRDFLNPEYYKDAPHFRRIGDGPEYRLEIPSAKLDFTGTYSVIASNCHGEAKAVISLQIFARDILKQTHMEKGHIRHGNIETLPRFIRNLRNLRCADGDAITLECHVEALPEPFIIWEKDGRVLPSDKDYLMSYDGIKATLSIPRVYPEDEGEYTCVAKNAIGRTLSSACIIVDVPEEKENMLSRQLTRPSGLLSAHSTPRSTPRSTPNRSFSPRRLSYRNSSIDLSYSERRRSELREAIAAPKFLAIPYNRVVEEGDSVRFQCAITGHPTPWATWDKDGMIVTPTTRIAVKEVDDLRFIEIEEVTFDDAGLYRITLENDYGRIEATARLDVIKSSRYGKSPSTRSVRASSSRRNAYLHRRIMGPSTAIGGRMALATGFRGSSVPSCKFYHNNMELSASERIHIDVYDEQAMLVIDNVTAADEGVYTCVIFGDHDPLISSINVKFHDNAHEANKRREVCRAHIVEPLPELTKTIEGEVIDLCCSIECSEPYKYVWTRNGEILRDCSEFNYIDHGNGMLTLRINDAFDIDSGIYRCHISTNPDNWQDFDCTTSGELCVKERDLTELDESIQLLKSPLPVVCTAGTDALFYARVYPCEADAQWYLNGQLIEADSSKFMLESYSNNGVRVLRLPNVQLLQSGEVRLQVRHPEKPAAPAVRSYTSLLVLPGAANNRKVSKSNISHNTINNNNNNINANSNSKSNINKETKSLELSALTQCAETNCILTRPEDCMALIGGNVTLSVSFIAFPGTKVVWYKACHPIVEGRNISINTTNNQSTLHIADISTDDSGKYTVEVMNELSIEAAVASVAVEGPPEAPSGKPSISLGPDRVAVAWCGPPYDGGCALTGFIIEMQQLASTSKQNPTDCDAAWQEVTTVVDSLAYTVKNLQPKTLYRFRVRAENVHGCSAPSQPSEFVQMRTSESTTEDFNQTINVQAGGDFKTRFEIIEELGKGRFGVVYKVQEKTEPRQVLAAKVIKCIKSRDRQKVLDEISIMRSLKHPKLLQLAASFESAREIVMVMEYITGGELFERVVADDFTLTEKDCILFLRQVCEGVAYMHSQSVVHLDLKPENIMCHTRTSHQIKIIDFGLAQRLDAKAPVRVLFGTPEFIPPEIIGYEPICFKSDMWSVGVICYVLLSGLSPFMGDSDAETFANITRADYDFDDEAFDCVSQEAKDFISNLLVHRKENRWTAKQCLESKWLSQGHDDNLSNNKICTDKLKKFIIRRKWQKTGNAIRALGRMATLSASRRNSAISMGASLPSSPRPSISGIPIFNPNISAQMSSLHEEEDDFSIEMPIVEQHKRVQRTFKMRDKSQCSERSDSGYSECSNCSATGGANGMCHCAREFDKQHVVPDTNVVVPLLPATQETLLSVAVPHNLLKSKLEEIANKSKSNKDDAKIEVVTTEQHFDDNQNKLITTFNREHSVPVLEELRPGTGGTVQASTKIETIMASDFTNTIKMRKKSLENSVTREKIKQHTKPMCETSGKVSLLKDKFNQPNMPRKPALPIPPNKSKLTSSVRSSGAATTRNKLSNYGCSTIGANKSFGGATTTSRVTASTGVDKPTQTRSMPNSPLPQRSITPSRLSNRVREATERLAQQQTISTSARRHESRSRLPLSGRIHRSSSETKHIMSS